MLPTPRAAVSVTPVLPGDVEIGQVLLVSKDLAAIQDVLSALANENIQPITSTRLNTLGWSLALFQFADHATAAQQVTRWQQRFSQVSVDFNYLYRTQAGVTGREYALGMLDLPPPPAKAGAASKATHQALRAIRVGMLDTEVMPTAWLRDVTLATRPFAAESPSAASDLPAHPAHGTAIASLIARIAPSIRLFNAVVMSTKGDQAVTTSYRLIQGADWLLEQRVQVINMSLSGRYDKNFAMTIAELMQRDVLLTAAAGNHGSGAPPAYPAAYASSYTGMLAVTAIDVEGQLYSQANHGAYISVAAPGVNIWVPGAAPAPHAPLGVAARYVSGTSYASAYAAGALAYWLSKRKVSMTAPYHFCETAKDLGPTGRDDAFGCGLLQVNAALRH
ncbi:S8 family serine peptidase [Polaromonas sp.]|uniref:S8 family serine peptidase n=1 Tax=Polaromonas sp. TaxID=1869339 RepID=UPI0032631299